MTRIVFDLFMEALAVASFIALLALVSALGSGAL